jgi:hypothetical protein
VRELLQFLQLVGGPPFLATLVIGALLILALTIIVIRAAVKHKVPIETKAGFFNLRVGSASTPNLPPKMPHRVRLVVGFRQ